MPSEAIIETTAIVISEEQYDAPIAEVISIDSAKNNLVSKLNEYTERTKITVLDKIMFVEEFILTLDQAEIPCTHNFANGVYVREMVAPRNCVITGEIHKDSHMIMMSYGDCSVLSTDGQGTIRYKGHNIIIIPPGVKRLFFIHEETAWATVHRTDCTDIKEVEKEIFDRSYILTEEKRNILKQTPLIKDMFIAKEENKLWLE